MKYCITIDKKQGTCYHEFYRGRWDEVSFWKKDSLLLHDDILFSMIGFVEALETAFPDYDPFGETEVSVEKWRQIGEIISKKSRESQELYAEIDEWATDV